MLLKREFITSEKEKLIIMQNMIRQKSAGNREQYFRKLELVKKIKGQRNKRIADKGNKCK